MNMNEFDILSELEKLDDDIEAGFLSELKQQTPDELHSRIMASIRLEAQAMESSVAAQTVSESTEQIDKPIEKKSRFRFNHRRYATVASAAAILAIVFIGGAKELINKPITSETISPQDGIVMTSKAQKKPVTTDQPRMFMSTQDNSIKDNRAPVSQAPNAGVAKAPAATPSPTDKPIAKADPKTGSTGAVTPKKSPVVEKPKTTPRMAFRDKTGTTAGVNAGKDEQDMSIVASEKSGDLTASEPTNGNTTPTTEVKPTETATPESGNIAKSSGRINDSGVQDTLDPNDPRSDLIIASLENIVNYELTLQETQVELIDYVKENSMKIHDGVYRMKLSNYNELLKQLKEINVSPVKVNELEQGAQEVGIKLIIN